MHRRLDHPRGGPEALDQPRAEQADRRVAQEIAPCFVEKDGRRTDHVVLACTHFPLLMEALRRAALWPVTYVDPAPAIARRLDALLGPIENNVLSPRAGVAIFTSGEAPRPALEKALFRFGLTFTPSAAISLATT